MTLDDYSKSDYLLLQAAVQADSRLRRVCEILRTHRLTRLGDLNVVTGIQKALGSSSPVVVRHSRDATFCSETRIAHRGSICLKIGSTFPTSAWTMPWVSGIYPPNPESRPRSWSPPT